MRKDVQIFREDCSLDIQLYVSVTLIARTYLDNQYCYNISIKVQIRHVTM